MKNVIVGMVAVAGIAAIASAQSTLVFQVRTAGSSDSWASSINALPGQSVEFRALISYTGTTAPAGLATANMQPTVSNWNLNAPGDTLNAFANLGGNSAAPGAIGITNPYGRISPFAAAGVSTTNILRGHTNNVIMGIPYRRGAQNTPTNWVGVGATSGVTAANNFNSAGGISVGQAPFSLSTPAAPFSFQLVDIEVLRLAITLGSDTSLRTMEVDAPLLGLRRNPTTGLREFAWFRTQAENIAGLQTSIITTTAFINVVPTPGALALLGLGGIVAVRRRR